VSTLRAQVEARIRDEVPDLREVDGAAGIANIMAGRIADKGCYIFQKGSSASKNNLANRVSQRETIHLGVVLTVKNIQDARGADADDVSQALRDSIREKLLGWEPDGYEPLEKVDGKLISFANGNYITLDTYSTAHHIRSI
jgi:hypothetical protein